jgi:hypothetical protein
MNTVKILKMVTGEDVLGTVTDEGDTYLIENPLMLVITGEGGIVSFGWSTYVKENKVRIKKSHVLFCEEALPDLVAQHKEKFSNIVVAPSMPDLRVVK